MTGDQRKFPRIYLQSSARAAAPILGASAHWPGGQKLEVFDLSYIGVAVLKQAGMEAKIGEKRTVQIELSGEDAPIDFPGEVARITDRVVALRFDTLPTQALRALDRFLHAKLLGLHMRPIDRKFFSQTATFTHWFHGPNNTDVFLWFEELALKKAVVEIGGDFLKWKGGTFFTGVARQVLDREGDDYLKPLLDGDFDAESGAGQVGLTPMMSRTLDLLSQIDDPAKVLQPLVNALLARQKGSG